MRLKLGERARPLTLAVTKDAGHRQLGVVITKIDFGTPPKNVNARTWPSQKGFRRLRRIADHEAGV